jgi:type I restriction enzyme, R subunit
VYVSEYRRRVEERLLTLAAHSPALAANGRGEGVEAEALVELERLLQQELGGGELEATPANLRQAYGVQVESFLDLLRLVLEMDAIPGYAEIVGEEFQRFITAHVFNADQIRFLRAVQSVFLQKRRLALADLYQEPLTNFGEDAVDRWFSREDVDEILALSKRLTT